jgi:hypothetical protein
MSLKAANYKNNVLSLTLWDLVGEFSDLTLSK